MILSKINKEGISAIFEPPIFFVLTIILSLHVVMDFVNNESFLENIMNNKIILIFVAIKNLNFLIFYTKKKPYRISKDSCINLVKY